MTPERPTPWPELLEILDPAPIERRTKITPAIRHAAFLECYQQTLILAQRIIKRYITKGQMDAEDLASAAMIDIIHPTERRPQLLENIKRSRNPDAYILTMLRNKVLDELRKESRQHPMSHFIQSQLTTKEANTISTIEDEELTSILSVAVQKLSEPDREIVLAKLSGRSTSELAISGSVPTSVMAVRVSRALSRLGRLALESAEAQNLTAQDFRSALAANLQKLVEKKLD